VARLMREEGLHGRAKGHFKPHTTDSRHARPVAKNLLDRQFAVASDRPAWVGDITTLPTREGGCTWRSWSTCRLAKCLVTASLSVCLTIGCAKPCSTPGRIHRPPWGACSTPTGAASTPVPTSGAYSNVHGARRYPG
jgi:hypothetical protein